MKSSSDEAALPGQIARGGALPKLRLHIFELASAIGWALVGFNYLVNSSAGDRSPIGMSVHPFDYVWSTMYVVAMPLIVAGIARESQRFRVAGLTLLGTGLFMQFIAAVGATPLETRDLVYLCYSIACLLRGLIAAETVRPVVSRRARS